MIDSESPMLEFEETAGTFKITDTILSLVRFKKGGVGLVILGVDKIVLDKKIVWSLKVGEFNLAIFTGCILLCSEAESKVVWKGLYGECITVEGASSVSFNATINDNLYMFFEPENLLEAKDLLQTVYSSTQPVLPLINYPYNAETKIFCLTMHTLETNLVGKERCKVVGCEKMVKLQMRLHVGVHIVNNETRSSVWLLRNNV